MVCHGERFGRHLRLLKPVDYRRVFANPSKSSDGNFTVLAAGNHLGYPRLGLAIARKQVPLAVARNRIKRVVRESFRRHLQLLPPLDIVVLARRGSVRKSSLELHQSIAIHWSRISRKCVV